MEINFFAPLADQREHVKKTENKKPANKTVKVSNSKVQEVKKNGKRG